MGSFPFTAVRSYVLSLGIEFIITDDSTTHDDYSLTEGTITVFMFTCQLKVILLKAGPSCKRLTFHMPAAGICLRAGHEWKETQEIQSLSGESLILIPATGKRHKVAGI